MLLKIQAGLLRPEHVTRLNKNSDYKIVVKTIGEKISSLQNMQKELEDLESHHVEAFKNHLKELMKELHADEARIEKLLESCSFLRHSYSEKKRTQNLADSYQKHKWTGKLTAASWGKQLAASAAKVVLEEVGYLKTYGIEGELRWDAAMVFENSEGCGSDIYAAINELQMKHSQEVEGKATSMVAWLDERPTRPGVLVKIAGSDQVPQLQNRVKLLPEGGVLWDTDASSSGWIASARTQALCWGLQCTFLSGIGCFVQLCPNSAPVTFLMIPGEQLSKAGLLNFSEAPAFVKTESGAKLVREVVYWYTLVHTDQILYMPYTCYAILVFGFFTNNTNKATPEISTY